MPHSIIQLINKERGSNMFGDDDLKKVNEWSEVIASCQLIMKQLEEFNAFRSNFGHIIDRAQHVGYSIDDNKRQLDTVIQNFLTLDHMLNQKQINRDTRFIEQEPLSPALLSPKQP